MPRSPPLTQWHIFRQNQPQLHSWGRPSHDCIGIAMYRRITRQSRSVSAAVVPLQCRADAMTTQQSPCVVSTESSDIRHHLTGGEADSLIWSGYMTVPVAATCYSARMESESEMPTLRSRKRLRPCTTTGCWQSPELADASGRGAASGWKVHSASSAASRCAASACRVRMPQVKRCWQCAALASHGTVHR